MGFLWTGIGFPEWLAQITAQTALGFLLIAAVLTPLWKWLENPLTPGGAGNRRLADGRRVYEVLAEYHDPRPEARRSRERLEHLADETVRDKAIKRKEK